MNHYGNVTALRTALGAENGEIALNINPLNRGGNSVLPATEYHSEDHYYTKEDIERKFGSALRQQVPLRTLDGLVQEMKLPRIRIIKIRVIGKICH